MNHHATSTPLLNSYKGGSRTASSSPARLTPNVRSPKYLIASPTCGTLLRRPLEKAGSPMLNSTVNVSLYTNTQSPGLASRIVQYDRAQNGSSATHNTKFGSPGLFPIVHLYKQSLPVASPKPKRVTVKIAPPDDISMYNRVEHSIIMSENVRITKIHEQPANGTRSVLDALKEISRKRIHSAAEFESTSPEGGTRKRNKQILETSQANSTPHLANATSKRAREESPTDISSPSATVTTSNADKNIPKRYCSIDPITASFTSANLRFQELRKDAAKGVEEYRDDLPLSPLRKTRQVSVDTQTNVIETELKSNRNEFEQEIVETPTKPQTPLESTKIAKKSIEVAIESPLFDPKPLEIIRRNKLAALLGAISGEVPILENLIDAPREEIPNAFPITSILSSSAGGKSATEAKHVTFDLPTPPLVTPNPLMAITQTTTALIMPIPSTMVAPFRDTTASVTPSLPVAVSVTSFTPASTSPSDIIANSPAKIVGGFKFDLSSPSASKIAVATSTAALASSSVSHSVPDISANDVPPKFGFQFTKSNDVVETNESQSLVATLKSFAVNNSANITNLPSANFSFGAQPASTGASPANGTFTFGNAAVASKADPPKSFIFNAISAPVTSKTTQFNDTSSANTTSSLPLFSSTSATANMFQKPSSSPFQTDATNPLPGFGAANSTITTANSVGFPLTRSTTTTKFDIGSGNNLFTATTANKNSTTFSFGGGNSVPLASTINFGSTVDKVAPSFGAVNNSAPAVTIAPNNIFGPTPFGSSPAVSTNSNFAAFAGGIKELTQPPAGIKFGETAAATTVANIPPTTTAQSLFNFGSGTCTDIQKPLSNALAFNQLKDNSVPNGFGASKLTFANFGTNSFASSSAEVPANQAFSFGGGANTFAPPADANFTKPANFEATFGGQQVAPFNAQASFSGSAPQQTKLFSFGAATAIPAKGADPLAADNNKAGSVFAFGTTAAVKPQATTVTSGFNFSAGAGFGAGNVAPVMFGSPQAAPSFNVGGFSASAMVGGGSPGMFSIGSGSSSGPSRPRTQLKTKRRT